MSILCHISLIHQNSELKDRHWSTVTGSYHLNSFVKNQSASRSKKYLSLSPFLYNTVQVGKALVKDRGRVDRFSISMGEATGHLASTYTEVVKTYSSFELDLGLCGKMLTHLISVR